MRNSEFDSANAGGSELNQPAGERDSEYVAGCGAQGQQFDALKMPERENGYATGISALTAQFEEFAGAIGYTVLKPAAEPLYTEFGVPRREMADRLPLDAEREEHLQLAAAVQLGLCELAKPQEDLRVELRALARSDEGGRLMALVGVTDAGQNCFYLPCRTSEQGPAPLQEQRSGWECCSAPAAVVAILEAESGAPEFRPFFSGEAYEQALAALRQASSGVLPAGSGSALFSGLAACAEQAAFPGDAADNSSLMSSVTIAESGADLWEALVLRVTAGECAPGSHIVMGETLAERRLIHLRLDRFGFARMELQPL